MKIRILILSIAVLCLLATPVRAVLFGDGGAALQLVLDAPQDLNFDGNIDSTIPTTGPYAGVQDNYYGILRAGPSYPSNSVTAATDEIPDSLDSYWKLTGSGGSVNTLIIEIASWAGSNTFGVYSGGVYAQVFAGGASAGSQATLSILADGTVKVDGNIVANFAPGTQWFGYYLDSTGSTLMSDLDGDGVPETVTSTGGLWHSDSSLNLDNNFDHMAAYQGLDLDTVQLPTYNPGLWTDDEYILAWEDIDSTSIWTDNDFTDMVLMVESVMVPVPAAVILGVLGIGVAGLKLRKFA